MRTMTSNEPYSVEYPGEEGVAKWPWKIIVLSTIIVNYFGAICDV